MADDVLGKTRFLSGRVAVVTGATGGFGRVFVQAFLDAGASVVALDINDTVLSDMHSDAAKNGIADRLLVRKTNIGEWQECASAVRAAEERFGGVHILVNNAAVGMSAVAEDHLTRQVSIEEISPEIWDRFASVNFSGAWYMTRASIGHMKQAGWGRIIQVTTNLSTMLRPGFHPYGPSKAGMEAMAAGHAREFASFGITVNVLIPGGPSDTAMVPQQSGFERSALVPPQAMTPPALWLCTDEAANTSGLRITAAEWDPSLPAHQALKKSTAPIAWRSLVE
jgi:NAD(P)-dependent dehydrogenase (short-subunit alcohol dehydrogenase family)